jgi:NAD(P)-dependent dehydrogenase (short-subunit alcohol dehydrogenase family)
VNLFTKAAAEEGRSANIRVFAIAPGAVETAMLRSAFPGFPADKTLAVEEVAGMVAALLDPRCVCATGTVIPIRK